MKQQLSGVELIAAERKRQIEVEGWTLEHDLEYEGQWLSQAAACYAMPELMKPLSEIVENGKGVHMTIERWAFWPFAKKWWKPAPNGKPEHRVRELVKAGALIAAEIDRLQNIKL